MWAWAAMMGKGREVDEQNTAYAYTSTRWSHPTLIESDGDEQTNEFFEADDRERE